MTNLIGFIQTWLTARFTRSEKGASLVEYALLVALIGVACIVAIGILGDGASTKFSEVGSQIRDA